MVHSPFQIQVAEEVLLDLKQRLARIRWPDALADADWDYGTNLAYLQHLIAYWQESYDWRAQERLLNTFPQFTTVIDGIHLHFLHIRGKGTQPLPLLISHGWPGSFFEMSKIIGPLTDPERFGADPADAFDVVVPSLPGYGFSGPTKVRGVTVERIAEVFVALMGDLGYPRFAARSYITSTLGRSWPSRVFGIHLNTLPERLVRSQEAITEVERRWRQQRTQVTRDESGYSDIQGTRPQTLAYGLNDSPVGLASWIIEKFRAWSDCHGEIESVFTKEELLTNVMIYWVTQTINSSAFLYLRLMKSWRAVPEARPVRPHCIA